MTEPASGTLGVYLGEYTIEDVSSTVITIYLGRSAKTGEAIRLNVSITGIAHKCRPGDKLPLYTRVPYEVRDTN